MTSALSPDPLRQPVRYLLCHPTASGWWGAAVLLAEREDWAAPWPFLTKAARQTARTVDPTINAETDAHPLAALAHILGANALHSDVLRSIERIGRADRTTLWDRFVRACPAPTGKARADATAAADVLEGWARDADVMASLVPTGPDHPTAAAVHTYLMQQVLALRAIGAGAPVQSTAEDGGAGAMCFVEFVRAPLVVWTLYRDGGALADRRAALLGARGRTETPLYQTARSGHSELAQTLLAWGADPNERATSTADDGRVPLSGARSDDMVRVLVSNDADPLVRLNHGLDSVPDVWRQRWHTGQEHMTGDQMARMEQELWRAPILADDPKRQAAAAAAEGIGQSHAPLAALGWARTAPIAVASGGTPAGALWPSVPAGAWAPPETQAPLLEALPVVRTLMRLATGRWPGQHNADQVLQRLVRWAPPPDDPAWDLPFARLTQERGVLRLTHRPDAALVVTQREAAAALALLGAPELSPSHWGIDLMRRIKRHDTLGVAWGRAVVTAPQGWERLARAAAAAAHALSFEQGGWTLGGVGAAVLDLTAWTAAPGTATTGQTARAQETASVLGAWSEMRSDVRAAADLLVHAAQRTGALAVLAHHLLLCRAVGGTATDDRPCLPDPATALEAAHVLTSAVHPVDEAVAWALLPGRLTPFLTLPNDRNGALERLMTQRAALMDQWETAVRTHPHWSAVVPEAIALSWPRAAPAGDSIWQQRTRAVHQRAVLLGTVETDAVGPARPRRM